MVSRNHSKNRGRQIINISADKKSPANTHWYNHSELQRYKPADDNFH